MSQRKKRKKRSTRPGRGRSRVRAKSRAISTDRLTLIILLVFIAALMLIRLRMLGVPLERDEGEYAYMGQLMLRGIPPYALAYNMKLPGTHAMYGVFMAIFGQTVQGIHLGLALVNAASVAFLYYIGRHFMRPWPALFGAMAFGVLTLGNGVLGFAFHATHLVSFFALAGVLVLLKAVGNNRYRLHILAGVLLGLSVVMKQAGIFFLLFGAVVAFLYPKVRGKTWITALRTGGYYVAGALIVGAVLLGILWSTGVFDKFWFWNVTYLKEYGTNIDISTAFQRLKYTGGKILPGYYLFWVAALLGLVLSFLRPGRREDKWIIWLFVLCAVLTVVPGFYFRRHYFITLTPALGLCFGLLVFYAGEAHRIKREWANVGGLFLLIAATSMALRVDGDYLFSQTPDEIARTAYHLNPFPESVVISEYIREHSDPDDRILVLGSEPQIYFYSRRLSSTGYIYMYNMMEIHEHNLAMQKEMVSEVGQTPPEYIVYVNMKASWLRLQDSPMYIFNWRREYIGRHYNLVGVVDIGSNRTVYKWGNDARTYQPASDLKIQVFRRRG